MEPLLNGPLRTIMAQTSVKSFGIQRLDHTATSTHQECHSGMGVQREPWPLWGSERAHRWSWPPQGHPFSCSLIRTMYLWSLKVFPLRSLLPHLPLTLQPPVHIVCHSEDATKCPVPLGPLQQLHGEEGWISHCGGLLLHGWVGHPLGSQLGPRWARKRTEKDT